MSGPGPATALEAGTEDDLVHDWSTVDVLSWDLDGTLYDLGLMKRRLFRRVGGELLRGRWGALWRDGRLLRRHQAVMRDVRLAGGDLTGVARPWSDEALQRAIRAWYVPAIQEAGPAPGVLAAIAAASARGLRQVLVSDYREGGKLEALGIDPRPGAGPFDACFAGEVVGALKPSARLFEEVTATLGVVPARLTHIGDRDDTDAVAAVAAGCRALVVGRDFDDFHALARSLAGCAGAAADTVPASSDGAIR